MEWFDTFWGERKCIPIVDTPIRRTSERWICPDLFNLGLYRKIPFSSSLAGNKSKFGFFTTEEEGFRRIATELGLIQLSDRPLKYARHPLVYLVEAADDICYQMMDIEDAHKLKILTTEETKELLLAYFADERQTHIRKRSILSKTRTNRSLTSAHQLSGCW